MKKISTLILLIAFQFGAFAQADVTSSVLTNPGFEASPFDTGWTLVQNKGTATFTDGGTAEAFSGDHVGLVEVTDAQGIWQLYLERTLNTTGFSNKDLEIAFKTKRLWTAVGANAGKVQLFVGEPGGTNLVPAGHNGGNREQWYDSLIEDTYEDVIFTITVPSGVTQLVMQLWVGGKLGSYFFDDFKVTGEAENNNLLTGKVAISGDVVLGENLTATVSDANSTELNYQWKRNGAAISGATQSGYSIVAEDVGAKLLIEVTADDKDGIITDETGIVLENAFQFAAAFEKLKKGVNQDSGLPFSGTFQKLQHERAHMEAIANAGFESVRIFLPYNADYTKFETRIQDALDYDLAVVVCMWGSKTWAGNISTGITQFTTRWEQITQAWKTKFSNDVVFELLNEPEGIGFVNVSTYPDIMALFNSAIPAIRAIDSDRPILVGMPGHNDSEYIDPWVTETYLDYELADGTSFFDDQNMGVAIHFYRPNGSDGNNWAFYTASQLNTGWEATIDFQLNHAVNWQNMYNTTMPVVVTEWGCWLFESRNNSTDLLDWLDYHMDKFEEHGFGSMWYTGVQNNQRAFSIFDSELGWNQVVLDRLTGVTNPIIPSTSQLIDSEFLSWGSNTWKLTSNTGVTKSFVGGTSALSGSHSLKLAVSSPTNCQVYQRTLTHSEDPGQAPGRTLIHLIQNETYQISFMAKAESSNGELKILMKDANNLGIVYYKSDAVNISTTTDTYALSYTHTNPTAMDVRFEFDIGSKAQTLILDKVSLKRQSDNLSTYEFSKKNINMYPNPTNGVLNFESIKEIKYIEVMDITGEILKTVKNQSSINMKSLASGIYIIRIGLPNNESFVEKVIKK